MAQELFERVDRQVGNLLDDVKFGNSTGAIKSHRLEIIK